MKRTRAEGGARGGQGAGRGSQRAGSALGAALALGSRRRRVGRAHPAGWRAGRPPGTGASPPEARAAARGPSLGWSGHSASSPSGLGCVGLAPGPGNPVLEAAEPPPRRARAAGGRAGRGWRPLIMRNELFTVPGVGEDEPVIIFKFAIIDLGKSYCDKNELIIKFISEINSVALKPLAGDAGAASRSRLPGRQVPAPNPGSLCWRTGAGVTIILSSFSAPLPLVAEGANDSRVQEGLCLGVEGRTLRRGRRRPSFQAGCYTPSPAAAGPRGAQC